MNSQQKYYLRLLKSRAKRLNELLDVAAPSDMIYKEVMLLSDAARPFAPNYWEEKHEETQGYRQVATG